MRLGIRELVFLLLLVAMPVAAYFFVFEPRNAQINEAREEIQQKQLKLKQLEAATRSMDDLGKEIEKLSKAIEIFEHKLPAQREVEVVLQQVWEMASRQRLVPKRVQPEKPIAANQYSEQRIRMRIVGDFDGFYRFLLDLERLRRITRMPQMKMKKISSEEGQLEIELTMSVFFDSDEVNASSRKERS